MSLFHEMNVDKISGKISLRRAWRWLWGLKPLYWLRCHTFTRYHLVDCRTTDYRWGWIDRSTLLLNAPFNILVEFIEKEKPFEFIQWDPHDEAELKELYRWWKVERSEDHKRLDELLDAADIYTWFTPSEDHPGYHEFHSKIENETAYNAYNELEEDLRQKDQWMLARLYNIREKLWT